MSDNTATEKPPLDVIFTVNERRFVPGESSERLIVDAAIEEAAEKIAKAFGKS